MTALYKCSIAVICLFTFSNSAQAQDYIGCYADNNDARALPQRYDEAGSIQLCQSYCKQNSIYSYFGAQFGSQCFCGETYARYGQVNDSECSYTCFKDNALKCGGVGRNSVYYVCPRGSFGPNCAQNCDCKDEEFCDRNGKCLNGVDCKNGWAGETCSIDIDECELEPCDQRCTNTPGSFYCTCYNNIYSLDKTDNRTCLDVNECMMDNGGCAQHCNNTEGSYHCWCNRGFNSTDSGKACVDINECAINNGGCSDYCNNTIGSFVCSCPVNLKLSGDGYNCKDSGGNPWKAAYIVLASLLGALLLSLPFTIYVLITYVRRKLNTRSEENTHHYEDIIY